jgi:hypothetical protein
VRASSPRAELSPSRTWKVIIGGKKQKGRSDQRQLFCGLE